MYDICGFHGGKIAVKMATVITNLQEIKIYFNCEEIFRKGFVAYNNIMFYRYFLYMLIFETENFYALVLT
jgi:hypothetical protein